MKLHTLVVFTLGVGLGLFLQGFAWQSPLHLMTGGPDRSVQRFLDLRKVPYSATSSGLDLGRQDEAFRALYDLMNYHRRAADLCLENVQGCKGLCADGLPYRRKVLVMNRSGAFEVQETSGEFNWVYDPSNPQAVQDGEHKGYVAQSSVNPLIEMHAMEHHTGMADSYRQLLQKFRSPGSQWAIFPSTPWNGLELEEAAGD